MTTREGVPVVVPPSHAVVSNQSSDATTPQALVASSSSSSSSLQDPLDPTALKIRKSWRQVVSSAVITFRTADKFRVKLAAVQQQNPHLDTSSMFSKEVDEGIVTSLRARADFRKNLTVLEGKISGQAQEAEALESCRRTQSRLGRKRRKRNVPTKEEEPSPTAATTTTATTVPPTPAITVPVDPSVPVHSTGLPTVPPQASPVTPSSTTVPGVFPQQPPTTLPTTTPPQVQNPLYSPPPF
mmetsp:Transcript_20321/g.28276  ORF Transcript_20321/g.28276 Transcript_20321/m.28276 type:complete len:241 (-) Transcript_20321:1202-1924(-)